VSGSYAYVTTHDSASLVVVDISNPVSPVIRGSVVSSSLMNEVREALSRVAQIASGAALASIMLIRPRRHRFLMPLALSLVNSHVLCTQHVRASE